MVTEALGYDGRIATVLFSGDVSEYLYEVEAGSYGDLGIQLGRRIRELTPEYLPGIQVEPPLQRIRATVIGASQFTAHVSGNTIYIKNPALLPQRNLQVVTVHFDDADLGVSGIEACISTAFARFEVVDGETQIALAVHWPHGPAYQHLSALSNGLAHSLARSVQHRIPWWWSSIATSRAWWARISPRRSAVTPTSFAWTACSYRTSTTSTSAKSTPMPVSSQW